MESKTPRTDDAKFKLYDEGQSKPCVVVKADFAEKLETELAEARAEIEHLRLELLQDAEKVRAFAERKNALIEQMRTALKTALKADPCPAKDYWQTVETEHHRGECWHAKAQAALSAAERGE